MSNFDERNWLDSQLTGALVVDAAGAPPATQERVWLITEWFYPVEKTQTFESALTFNGKAWPYNERLTFTQNDSVHFRVINAAAIEHPLHLHGFYFRVARHGGARADTVVAPSMQPLQNMRIIPIGGSLSLSFLPTTPGNWVFHCHFASHVGEIVSLHDSPEANVVLRVERRSRDAGARHAGRPHDARIGDRHARHAVAELQGAGGGRSPNHQSSHSEARERATRADNRPTDSCCRRARRFRRRTRSAFPGPVLELKRGEPVRILVKNNLNEPSGVHWHGLEIESFPDGVAGFSGIGDKIMPPIPPGETFAAEFTPPRSGTFPYHSHLHEMRQIGSGMYGAIIVSDAPRDTTRDHVIVAGGGGLPDVLQARTVVPARERQDESAADSR